MGSPFVLAQVNIARMVGSREDPVMDGFFARIDEINRLAEASAGFVWRLKDKGGDATYLRPYDDDRMLFNLSVWESVEALAAFTYRTAHKELIAGRKQWFEHLDRPFMALWWIAAGHTPSVEEAKERLEHLQTHGPTQFAFGFKTAFPVPAGDDVALAQSSAKAGSAL